MLAPKTDRLTYAEAEGVGGDLRTAWASITGLPIAPDMADEQWADLVQFVLRRASNVIAERPEPGA